MKVYKQGIYKEIPEEKLAEYKTKGFEEVEELDDNRKKSLADMKVAELKDLCKEKGLEGYDNLKKEELIILLKGAE